MNNPGKKAREELEVIRKRNSNGLLIPAAIVKFAKRETTALHGYFEWDDTEAAKRYRLEQAAKVIRICITVHGCDASDRKIRVRTYHSLASDRLGKNTKGGYRHISEISANVVKMEELFELAIEDFERFKRKYEVLKEFGEVFSAFDEVLLASA